MKAKRIKRNKPEVVAQFNEDSGSIKNQKFGLFLIPMSQLPSFSENDLQGHYRRVDLIKQTADQIIKDFGWYGIEIKFSGADGSAYDELFNQVEPHVEKMLKSEHEKLMQVLYHIDVSEKKVAAAGSSSEKNSELLTRLIIMRELQKVVTRNYFSGRL